MLTFIFIVACLAWVTVEGWIFMRERGTVSKKNDQSTRSHFIASVVAGLVGGALISRIGILNIGGGARAHYMFGTLLIIMGILLRYWSVRTLGKFFRTTVMVQSGHKVIDHGPYRLIRHPSYAAIFLVITGIAVGMGNWAGLVFMTAILLYGINKRIQVEEAELVRSLGDNYRKYMKKTKKIVPYVY